MCFCGGVQAKLSQSFGKNISLRLLTYQSRRNYCKTPGKSTPTMSEFVRWTSVLLILTSTLSCIPFDISTKLLRSPYICSSRQLLFDCVNPCLSSPLLRIKALTCGWFVCFISSSYTLLKTKYTSLLS